MNFFSSFRRAGPASRLAGCTLLVTVFLLSIGAGILIQFVPASSANTNQAAPPLQTSSFDTPHPSITGTALTNETPTATATATPLPVGPTPLQKTPTSPPVVLSLQEQMYNQAMAKSPSYTSSMGSADSANWSVWNNSGQSCQYTNGYYTSSSPAGQKATFCLSDSLVVNNFAFQVDFKTITGEVGFGGGMMFRYLGPNEKWQGGYWLHIGIDGHYRFATLNGVLVDTITSAWRSGLNQTNTVLVINQGPTIYLYVNNQFVTQLDQGDYSQGRIGLTSLGGQIATSVQYSNLKLWYL